MTPAQRLDLLRDSFRFVLTRESRRWRRFTHKRHRSTRWSLEGWPRMIRRELVAMLLAPPPWERDR